MLRLALMVFLAVGVLRFGLHFATGSPTPVLVKPPPPPPEGSRIVRVKANELNVYGQVWHGIGGTGLGMGGWMLLSLPTSGPPALDLCIVTVEGGGTVVRCNARRRGGFLHGLDSTCPDKYECSWSIVLPRTPFGIVSINLDFGAPDANDLVDAVIVASPSEETADISAAVRAALPSLARTRILLPSWTGMKDLVVNPAEERRREAAFKVITPTMCAGPGGCVFDQSTMWLNAGS